MRIINPANGELIREIEEDTLSTIREKFARAKAGQEGWSRTPLERRLAIIQEFRRLVVERTDALAETLTAEVGKPLGQSKNELRGLLGRIDFFLERAASEIADDVVFASAADKLEERIRHEPLGVIANVSAWNYPYFVGANVFVPALLTGNSVLYKPSEFATSTGLAIDSALHDAGVPKDAFITVVGSGVVGRELVAQPVKGVFFTGSYQTGQRIAESVAPRMLRLQLELGGKDAAYVTDDALVEGAAAAVADGAFYNAGQSCCAVERIYVHAAVWEPFVAAFVKTVKDFVIGDPMAETTYIGPLTRREAALELLDHQVSEAVAKGAQVLTGGHRVPRPGYYFEPTVLTSVNHDMAVMRDESFGPVIGLMKVSSDDEARERMADTEYGLTAAVYSRSRERAEGILSSLAVGSAYWNCCDRVSPRLPWSGRGHSGQGSTLGREGIRAFLQPKAFHLRGA